MFNDAWIALGIFFGLLGLAFRQDALVIMSTLLLTVIPVAWLWNRYALHGVTYRRYLSEHRAFVGEEVTLTVQVANRKVLPIPWMKAEDELPATIPLVDTRLAPTHREDVVHLVNLFSLRWHERVTRRFRMTCVQRGFYTIGPVRLHASDVFGLFTIEENLPGEETLIVYPQVWPIEVLGIPPKDPFGNVKSDIRLFADPSRAVGLRDHRPEDGLKHIHWKASARQQRLQVKVYEPTTSPQWVLFLNVATLPEPYQGSDPKLLERAIEVAASVASHGVEQKHLVGLIANGTLPRSDQPLRVLPSRSPDQLMHILEALAAVTSFSTSRIADLMEAESPRLPWGATLVVITGVVSDSLRATMLRLKGAGRKMALVAVGAEVDSEQLPGIRVYRTPVEAMQAEETWVLEPVEVPA